jgi:anaphase-promoting complex subunit 1
MYLDNLPAGRLSNKNNAIAAFDVSAVPQAPCGGAENEMTAWPEFHAGVAAALRVIPSSSNLIRYWLLFKKPPKPTYSRAGMLLALGLSGELKTLSSPNQYRYLCQEHTAIMVALLMGLAASHRGTMDEATSRTLHMHIPARHQSAFGEVEIAPLTQAAAMVGLGLLYEGTGHEDTSEMLLQEIVRRPASSQSVRIKRWHGYCFLLCIRSCMNWDEVPVHEHMSNTHGATRL